MGAGKGVGYGASVFLFVVLLLSADHVTEARSKVLVEKTAASNVLRNSQLGKAEVSVGPSVKDYGGLDGGYSSLKHADVVAGGYVIAEPGKAAEDTYMVSKPVDGLATEDKSKSTTVFKPVGVLAAGHIVSEPARGGLATNENYIVFDAANAVELKNDQMEEGSQDERAAVGDTMKTGAGAVIHGRGLTGKLDNLKEGCKKLKAKIVAAGHKEVKHAHDEIHKAVKKHAAAVRKEVKHADDKIHKDVKNHGSSHGLGSGKKN